MDSVPEPAVLLVIAAAFVAGGLVKGLIGGGLPGIVVPIMAVVVEPAYAAALTLIPVAATNIWQALDGNKLIPVMRRFWPYLLSLSLGVAAGSQILVRLPPHVAALLIGVMVVLLSPVPLAARGFHVPPRREPWLNPAMGGVLGVLGGTTVTFAPTLIYLAALRLDKDLFVVMAATTAIFCMVPLYLGLGFSAALTWETVRFSVLLLVPTMAGYLAGRALRGAVSQRAFQWILSVSLAGIGCGLIWKGLAA